MTTFFGYTYSDFSWNTWKITHCSWPVLISKENKILLHISSSTGKYQFIGWRLDDSLSLRENALEKAWEVLSQDNITLCENNPCVIIDEIKREWEVEKLILVHYKAELGNESEIWEAEWKSLEEVYELEKENMLSSPNVVIAAKYFLES